MKQAFLNLRRKIAFFPSFASFLTLFSEKGECFGGVVGTETRITGTTFELFLRTSFSVAIIRDRLVKS